MSAVLSLYYVKREPLILKEFLQDPNEPILTEGFQLLLNGNLEPPRPKRAPGAAAVRGAPFVRRRPPPLSASGRRERAAQAQCRCPAPLRAAADL